MARRRREAPPESGDTSAPMEQPAEGAEPQIDVRMRGSAEAVKKQLGVATEEKPTEKKPEGNGHDDEKRKFVEALRNPKYIIRVKRMTPREWNGQKTNVEVWQAELPLDYQEIQAEVTKGFGGEKYRVAVVDPQSNSTIAADTFTVDGDPIIPESDMTQEEMDRVFMQGKPKSASELTIDGLSRKAEVTAKMLEVEALEAQLEDSRKRRENQGKPQPAVTQDNSRVDDLERRLTEAKHQAELESRDRKHAEEMRELKALIAQNAKPAKPEGQSETTLILQQMQKSQEAADKRFEALQKQMQDDKLNALLEEVKSIKNKPQQNNMLEMAETMLKLNKMISGVRGDDDEDDEDDDKDDDRPWWERAIDKLGGKFGDKFLDKLMEKFTAMEEKGEKVDREKFLAEMSQYADQVAAEAAAKHHRPGLPAPQPQAAPNPPLPAPPPPSRPAVTVPTPQATSLPPPPPPAPVQQQTVPTPTPAPEPPPKLTIEQEIVLRVGGVLEILEREIELRPHEYHWNYEGAFCSLPESVLEAVCAAPDPVTMMDAFAIPHISPEKLAEMKAKIGGNPKILAWVKAGHDELRVWLVEKQKDPKFDPFADEEEGGEE